MSARLEGRAVVVTGAGGFVGPHVVRCLRARGAVIRAISSAPGRTSAPLPADVETLTVDVTDGVSIIEAIRGADAVVHLAGDASVRASLSDPGATLDVHVGGTVNVLEACRRSGIGRFVYASSAEVYGRPDHNPVAEDAPLRPMSPYGAAKAAAECAVRAWSSTYGIASVILRPFSVYGPGVAPGSLVGTIVRQALSRGDIIVADMRPVRDYVYVADLANAIASACQRDAQDSLTLNLGSGIGTSVGALAEIVAAICASGPVVEDASRRRPEAMEIFELVADVRRLRAALGHLAPTPLAHGLELTVESMLSEVEASPRP